MKKSFLIGLSCVLMLSGCGNKEVEQPPIVEEVVQPEVVEPVKPEEPEVIEPEIVEPEKVEPEVTEPEIEEPEIIVEEPISFEIVPENNVVAGRGSLVFLHESNLVGTDMNTILSQISAPVDIENFGTPLRMGVISMEELSSLSGHQSQIGKYLILEYFIYNNKILLQVYYVNF